MPDNEANETDDKANRSTGAVNGNTSGASLINRRNVLRATGVGLISSTALTGTSLAKRPPTPVGSDGADVPTKDELERFPEDVRMVPQDQLPIESDALVGAVGSETSVESQGVVGAASASALPDCLGFDFEYIELTACPKDDGSLELSAGAFGIVADTLVVEPGEAVATGSARVTIPGLPGVIQEFTEVYTIQWSSGSIDYLHAEITLEAWDFGVGWYQVAQVDQTLIS